MKKISAIVAIVLTLTLVLGMTATANAATYVAPTITRNFSMSDSSWTKIAYRPGGMDLNIVVKAYTNTLDSNGDNVQYYLQMRGPNGDNRYEEADVKWTTILNGDHTPYTFYCGSDVYYVFVKTTRGSGSGIAGYN